MDEQRCTPALWWVTFDAPVRKVYAFKADGPTIQAISHRACDMRWARAVPTSSPDVTLFEFAYPLLRAVVEEERMEAFMRSVRMSGLHGGYRKAGTDEEYRF